MEGHKQFVSCGTFAIQGKIEEDDSLVIEKITIMPDDIFEGSNPIKSQATIILDHKKPDTIAAKWEFYYLKPIQKKEANLGTTTI